MAEKKEKKKPSTGSTQPLDPILSKWIERNFQDETPQSIDCYPLHRGKDREMRLSHIDIKGNEKIGAERAVEIANTIFSDCQIHCDALPANARFRGTKTYEIVIIDERRGGQAKPVGTHALTLEPRVHRPAPREGEKDDEAEEGDEAMSARKFLLESMRMVQEQERGQRENEGKIVGETMLLMKSALQDREHLIDRLFDKNLDVLGKFAATLEQAAKRNVEERAVQIDADNAAENRKDQQARRDRENMWTDVTRASLLEGVKILGQVFPSIGQLFIAQMTGAPLPEPPKALNGTTNGTAAAPPANGATQLAGSVPEEKQLVDRFIAAAEANRIDADHTSADKLFGKDDDNGAPVSPGVFSREQVAILAAVQAGKAGVETLDVLLPDSGRPESVSSEQIGKAMPYLTFQMGADLGKFFSLRKAARERAKPAN